MKRVLIMKKKNLSKKKMKEKNKHQEELNNTTKRIRALMESLTSQWRVLMLAFHHTEKIVCLD